MLKPVPQSLFRVEVFESQMNSGFGAIRLQRPLSGWFTSGACLVVVLSLAVILAVGKVGNFRHAHGVIVNGVGSFFVQENEISEIKLGQLVRLRCLNHTQRHELPSGRVMEVGRTPFSIGELPDEYKKHVFPNANNSKYSIAFYKVKVSLGEQDLNVRNRESVNSSGLDVEANISVGDRRVWTYVFKRAGH